MTRVDWLVGLWKTLTIAAGFGAVLLVRGATVKPGFLVFGLGAAVLIGTAGAWRNSRRRKAAEGYAGQK